MGYFVSSAPTNPAHGAQKGLRPACLDPEWPKPKLQSWVVWKAVNEFALYTISKWPYKWFLNSRGLLLSRRVLRASRYIKLASNRQMQSSTIFIRHGFASCTLFLNTHAILFQVKLSIKVIGPLTHPKLKALTSGWKSTRYQSCWAIGAPKNEGTHQSRCWLSSHWPKRCLGGWRT